MSGEHSAESAAVTFTSERALYERLCNALGRPIKPHGEPSTPKSGRRS